MNLDDILLHFERVRAVPGGFSARCPSHDDRNPSLSIRESNGRILVHCFAGCRVDSVLEAAGLRAENLFPDSAKNQTATTYDYTDETGKLLFQVLRCDPKGFRQRRPDGAGGWIWNLKGVSRVLYRFPDVLRAESVLIVEGEKDVETAREMGLVATCNSGGARKWDIGHSECLRSKRVSIIADADVAGRSHAAQVAASLFGKAESLKLLELPNAKDLSEWMERGGSRDRLLQLIEAAREWKPRPSSSVTAIIRPFSEIQPQVLRWLWPERIPLGKLTQLVGDPGLGKSLLSIDLASRVTRGSTFPDGSACDRGSVIVASAEDDAADTIRPRLDAAEADVSRVYILEGLSFTRCDGIASESPFQLTSGIAALEDTLSRQADVRLIVIDPISAYLGNTDSNSNAEVRGLLTPLASLAARHHVAILCVTHLRKSAGTAIHRAIGSIAFTGAARASWLVAADPTDNERRVFVPVKQNLGRNGGGLAFRVVAKNGHPALDWEDGIVTCSADDVLCEVGGGRGSCSQLESAETWLRQRLGEGPVAVVQIMEEAKAIGLSEATVQRAKASLGIEPSKRAFRGGWEWGLEGARTQDAQAPTSEMSTFQTAPENNADMAWLDDEDAQHDETSTFDTGVL